MTVYQGLTRFHMRKVHWFRKTRQIQRKGTTDAYLALDCHFAAGLGVAEIPKYRSDKVRVFSKPLAERRGITEVQWSQG
jgi:hypothetical protein